MILKSRLSKDDVYFIAKNDLKALDIFLGDKQYFLGDEPRSADASIFAFVAQLLHHDGEPFKQFLRSKLQNY